MRKLFIICIVLFSLLLASFASADCVNLTNAATYGTAINKVGNSFFVNENVVLCNQSYSIDLASGEYLFQMNKTGITLDGNLSVIESNASGAAFNASNNDITIKNFESMSNFTWGIYMRDVSGVTIDNVDIERLNSSYNGLATIGIGIETASNIVVNNSFFDQIDGDGNSAPVYGFYIFEGQNVYINNFTVEEVLCTNCGDNAMGLYVQDSGNITIDSSDFVSSSNTDGGELYGAIFSGSYDDILINKSSFGYLTTDAEVAVGIAMGGEHAVNNVTIQNCYFLDITAPNGGVGIYNVDSGLVVEDISMDGVIIGTFMGELTGGSATMDVTGATFVDPSYGIYIEGPDAGASTFTNINISGADAYDLFVTNADKIHLENAYTGLNYYFENANFSGTNVTLLTDYGKINYDSFDINDTLVDTPSQIAINSNFIEVISPTIPDFNESAHLTFYGISGYTNPNLWRGGVNCSLSPGICSNEVYADPVFTADVAYFTNYTVNNNPQPPIVGIPEFSDFALPIILVVVIGGFLVVKKREMQ